jgi:hypothetical protein
MNKGMAKTIIFLLKNLNIALKETIAGFLFLY